jgi:hypothetical protein
VFRLPAEIVIGAVTMLRYSGMRRIIAFSLYNAWAKYTVNAVINCMLAPAVYPGWVCRFYVDDTVPPGIVALLRTFDYVELVQMPRHQDAGAMLWRFLPAGEPGVDAMISRDADSWLGSREAACVQDWLASGREFHIIRDHCHHTRPIMGGLWGARGGALPEMAKWVADFCCYGTYDQGFLAERVYPLAVSRSLFHRGERHRLLGQITSSFDDGAVPIPAYEEIDEAVPGLSFLEAHRLNGFVCLHCRRTHPSFAGGSLERLPARALESVRELARERGLPPQGIHGLGGPMERLPPRAVEAVRQLALERGFSSEDIPGLPPPPPPERLSSRIRRRLRGVRRRRHARRLGKGL